MPGVTFLEAGFPFAQVSRLAHAERFARDPVYQVHKWWARRPGSVVRALLLAASLPADTTPEQFWELFACDEPILAGHHVADPFAGGATTLVEAARLGADVTGIDVDPLAVRIARHELTTIDANTFLRRAEELLSHLRAELGPLFGYRSRGAQPLHYFHLREVTCGGCSRLELMYRDLVLVRDTGRKGAVLRDHGISAFCPECRRLHHLAAGRRTLTCCGRRRRLADGTVRGGRYTCSRCGWRATHAEVKTASLPRVMIAVEETVAGERRVLREPTATDRRRAGPLTNSWWSERTLDVPVAPLAGDETHRVRGYGFEGVVDLFSRRQQAIFASAFAWIDATDVDDGIRDALRLGVSNALTSNNLLCGYATDYGRLASLFSGVRAYSLPVLSVELNPLHETAGRGTLRATLYRVAAGQADVVQRQILDAESGETRRRSFTARRAVRHALVCRSAERGLPRELGKVSIGLTDPPYFDFISYSDLSLVFRSWNRPGSAAEKLGGAPIFPVGRDGHQDFAERLGRALAKVKGRLRANAVLCFTFHATRTEAWAALEEALVAAGLDVRAIHPVWTDARSGSHAHAGNCEWDLVFVCRPFDPASPAAMLPSGPDVWIAATPEELAVGEADRWGMAEALRVAGRVSAGLRQGPRRSAQCPSTAQPHAIGSRHARLG